MMDVVDQTDTPVALVRVIDDDAKIRMALEDLFQSVGYDVACYESTADFLESDPSDRAGCLILDIRLPGVNGLDFQEQLQRDGWSIPVVLLTGHGDVPMSVRGMKAGAIDFIEKPFRDQDLLDAVARAIEEGLRRAPLADRRENAERRFAKLSRREREVIGRVINGQINKQIAFDLAISEVTVKIHRAGAMRKLGARSLVDLTRLAEALGI